MVFINIIIPWIELLYDLLILLLVVCIEKKKRGGGGRRRRDCKSN
jgi:hypothetical protein